MAFSTTMARIAIGVLELADEARDRRGAEQQQDHEVGELAEEHPPRAAALLFVELVAAVFREPLRGLLGRQSGDPASMPEAAARRLLGREQMPGPSQPASEAVAACNRFAAGASNFVARSFIASPGPVSVAHTAMEKTSVADCFGGPYRVRFTFLTSVTGISGSIRWIASWLTEPSSSWVTCRSRACP